MTLLTIAKRLKKADKPSYPPSIFDCQVEAVFKEKLGDDYSVEALAEVVGVTPATMKNIVNGCSVKLENALMLAQLAEKRVEDLWRLKR